MEQAQLGPDRMPDGWLTLREPTADFFDARRREELSSASSSRRQGGMQRHSSTAGSIPSVRDYLYGQPDDTVAQPDEDRPVQFLPQYLIARHRRDAKRRTGSNFLPTRQKRAPALEKAYTQELVPSLDLARVGLKSAPGGGGPRRPGRHYDRIRPATHGQDTRERDRHVRTARAAHAAAPPATLTPPQFAALPAPLMEALLLRGSGQSGAVSERMDLSRAALARASSAFVLVSHSMPDTLRAEPSTPHATPQMSSASKPSMTPRQRLAHQKSGEVLASPSASECSALNVFSPPSAPCGCRPFLL
jgi:hypothetical protein